MFADRFITQFRSRFPTTASDREGELEAALAAAQQRYHDFADGLDAIVWELDVRSRRFTFVTRYAEAALGYPRERWLDEVDFWSNVLHARDGTSIADVVAAARRKGREHQLEYPVLARDGWTVWLRDSIRVVPDAGGGKLRGVTVNITESKWGEEALRQSEARYRGLYEGVPLGLYRTSPQGELLAANDFFVRTLGYPSLEALSEAGEAGLPSGAAGDSAWSTALPGIRESAGSKSSTGVRTPAASGSATPYAPCPVRRERWRTTKGFWKTSPNADGRKRRSALRRRSSARWSSRRWSASTSSRGGAWCTPIRASARFSAPTRRP
jgi:PAS domain-containing protein